MAIAIQESQPASVLVVEDEGLIAQDIQAVLEQLGYRVSGLASSGVEALELASLSTADLVLMDIKIHGDIDGIETAEKIRQLFRVPVVYLTAHADTPTVDRAKVTEPFGYIVKPFTRSDIKVAIEMALTRHRLQQHLEEQEAWFSTILRSVGDAVIATDCDGNIKFLNAAAEALTGWRSYDAARRPVSEILRFRDDRGIDQIFNLSLQLNETADAYFQTGTLLGRDGSERLVVGSAAPVRRHEAAEIHGAVVVFRDISDLRKTEQALQETNWILTRSNEHLTQLSYSLSHDLKEPLRNVACYSGLLAKRHGDVLDGSGQEYLKVIVDGCKGMESLLSALLEYHRAGDFDRSAAVSTDSSIAASEALLNLTSAVEESRAVIHVGELPKVLSHPSALLQVFQSLIGNALRYKGEQRLEVQLSASREGPHWHFLIEDNGLGFPSDQAEFIFGLFKKAHGRNQSGSGVGLATCRRLIERYGGQIWAESVEGRGAKFHFTVPMIEPLTVA